MKITAYKVVDNPCPLVPGTKRRQWMDDTVHQYAYRCLPMPIANCTGWQIHPPCDFTIHWDGSNHKEGLSFEYYQDGQSFLESGFGCGIITFHPGYLFRTSPGWDLLVTGPPNLPISFAYPLSGVVETFWLPFTFTMNWKLYNSGSFHWNKKDPLAFIMPVPHEFEIETDIKDIKEDQELSARFDKWRDTRNQQLHDMSLAMDSGMKVGNVDPNNTTTHWEKSYMHGVDKDGNKEVKHTTNRKFPEFKDEEF